MINFFKVNNSFNKIVNLSVFISFIYLFYNLFFRDYIPISGDELNSILVYSTNIKTIFLKNFPGNVTFFHFIGYLKTKIFGTDLFSYRVLAFIFFGLHFFVLKKIKLTNYENLIILVIIINSFYVYYIGQYIGYTFSSLIFVIIFYLLINNDSNKYNKIILLLLFIQIYNHLVNLYLVGPILISLFLYSNKKKIFKEFIIYFCIPVFLSYSFSIILTGIALYKIDNTSFTYVYKLITSDLYNIVIKGFERIFFYEAYANAKKFNLVSFLINLFLFDKIYFIFFISSFILSLVNLKEKKISLVFSLIIIFHVFFLILINKDPAPRIFTGFVFYYLIFNFYFLKNYPVFKKLLNIRIIVLLIFFIFFYSFLKFNYYQLVMNGKFSNDFDLNLDKENKKLLNENCILKNNNFSELQKRNYYFNYINICKKDYNLSEFLIYYRS